MSDTTNHADVKFDYGPKRMQVYTFEPNPNEASPIWIKVDSPGMTSCGTLSLTAAQELCAGLSRAIMEHRQ